VIFGVGNILEATIPISARCAASVAACGTGLGQVLAPHDLASVASVLGLFDEIVCHAEKPDRFPARLAALAQVHDVPHGAVMSVGDHFVNEIAPALALGCATAYVDPFHVGPAGRATFEATRLEDLLPSLEAWASGERLAAVDA
jgi:hypothetical protein